MRTRSPARRRVLDGRVTTAVAVALVLGAGACGGHATTSTTTSSTPVTSTAAATTSTSPSTTAAATTTTTTTSLPPSTTTPATTSAPTSASANDLATVRQIIGERWERFFSASTPLADRESLLEHGATYHDALVMRSKDPLQAQASAHVKNVELASLDAITAAVTFDVLLNGQVALPDAAGTAVKEGGEWKVSGTSFCSLVTLGATAPVPGCS